MQITKTKKQKIKKLVRKKVAGLHVVSLVIMLTSGLFTGGVVLASELHANITEAELIKLEQKVNDELSDIASQANSRGSSQESKSSESAKSTTQNDADKNADTKHQEKSPESDEVPAQSPPPSAPAPISTSQASPAPSSPPPPPPPPAPASALETTSSLNYINSVRSSAGKSALQANSTVNQWALNHALTLANSCSLYHQEISQFLGQSVAGKLVVGVAENVGYASSIPQVLDGLKNSPGHYANMIGNYTHVGLGVVSGSGGCSQYIYTAQVFVRVD